MTKKGAIFSINMYCQTRVTAHKAIHFDVRQVKVYVVNSMRTR